MSPIIKDHHIKLAEQIVSPLNKLPEVLPVMAELLPKYIDVVASSLAVFQLEIELGKHQEIKNELQKITRY